MAPNYGGSQISVFYVMNFQTAEKTVIGENTSANATGASTAPNHASYWGKWVNTSSQITRVDFSRNVVNFGVGTRFIVFGKN